MKILILIISIIFLIAAIMGAALVAVWLSIKLDCTPDRCRNCCYFRGGKKYGYCKHWEEKRELDQKICDCFKKRTE